jgi:hypothetical protein
MPLPANLAQLESAGTLAGVERQQNGEEEHPAQPETAVR